jgi:hypothetical protein
MKSPSLSGNISKSVGEEKISKANNIDTLDEKDKQLIKIN